MEDVAQEEAAQRSEEGRGLPWTFPGSGSRESRVREAAARGREDFQKRITSSD